MKRIAYLLAVCCLLPSMALGQKNIRYWEKGPLTWNDFTQVDKSIGSEHSYLEFGLDVIDRKQEISGLQIAVRTAVAFCNKDMSWVDINYRTPEQLRYNQVLFNLVELHRRRLQVAVDTGQRVNMDYYMRLLTYEVDSFSRACNYGNNTAQVLWWEDEIRRQIGKYKRHVGLEAAHEKAMAKLVAANSFPVAEARVKRYIANNLKKEEPTEEEIKQGREAAENAIRRYRILDWVANKENIKPKQAEVDEYLQDMANGYGVPFEALKEHLRTSGRMAEIREEMRLGKTMDWLVGERGEAESK